MPLVVSEGVESLVSRSIQEWAKTPTPDHARLLIRTYHESEWRSTRLDVLRHFGHFQDSRSLQFLIDVATKNEDLAEQQLAILALSQRRTRTAQVFLRRLYAKAPDTLKPQLAYALGQSQDFAAIPVLLKGWDVAYSRQDWLWLRNMVLALGELKAFEALPRLRQLLVNAGGESELTFATLFAMGRLEREVGNLQAYESRYVEDSLLYQVFQSTLSQVQIRSQFKLEDYLEKVFTSPDPHPILPLELHAFDESEVEVGFSLFSIEEYWKRYLIALKGISPKKRVSYLSQIVALVTTMPIEDQIFFLSQVSDLFEQDPDAVFPLLEPFSKTDDAELRLQWLEAVAHRVEIAKEAAFFFAHADPPITIRFLNLWSEWALVKDEAAAQIAKTVNTWVGQDGLSPPVYARLIRAAAELKVESKAMAERFAQDFRDPLLRSSLLMWIEAVPRAVSFATFLQEVTALPHNDQEALGQRLLAAFEAYGAQTGSVSAKLEAVLKLFSNHFNAELRVGILRYLRVHPAIAAKPEWEKYVIEQSKHQNPMVELNAVVTLKGYVDSRAASEALIDRLESPSSIIQGRALDGLCAHSSLIAKRAVMDYLKQNLSHEEVVDKIYRSFDPKNQGGEEFVRAVDAILNANPDHPLWEKFVALRDRLALATRARTDGGAGAGEAPNEALREIDEKLSKVIPLFAKLDPTTQSALRAAEQPFLQAIQHQNLPVDKAPTVLEYCKAIDLILDRQLGQKHLFPKLDGQLHDFQTLWHRVGFGEDYPSADRVMGLLGLKGKITPENFPLHKAKMMCGTFFNGKIVQDRFKVFDGLRAWAVIFLIFARKISLPTGTMGPLVKLDGATDEKCVSIAKRLMMLQDLRNPAAHRQTYTDLSAVMNVRNEAIELLNTVLAFG